MLGLSSDTSRLYTESPRVHTYALKAGKQQKHVIVPLILE